MSGPDGKADPNGKTAYRPVLTDTVEKVLLNSSES